MASSLPCKLVAQVAFKAGGDVYHRLLSANIKQLTKISPAKFQTCELAQGSYATAGSVLDWKFTLDGKEQGCKQVIQDVDEGKKQIAYKFIEGEILEHNKSLVVKMHVETIGGVDFVTWTIDYELRSPDSPHPLPLLSFVIEFTKEIESHILG